MSDTEERPIRLCDHCGEEAATIDLAMDPGFLMYCQACFDQAAASYDPAAVLPGVAHG